jgi:hypothetical protein
MWKQYLIVVCTPAPAKNRPNFSTEALMTTQDRLTRRERLVLAAAAVRGFIAGAVHALLDWILDHTVN